ncbi:hypothetical protein CXF68_01220 [Tenacibaculum sp. Bg11-29]|uniref:hypothetical protein n=1 Tax=Tenacibaculum sp. Bg11-29 TaxID=2058306 RepID=UPI000C326746|nr:hypothetical protein [Tenacibaculum sp. Bg11-29]PKH49389.1 hypothetical protein CXF68_01220 [Tenacibaculum sp. Bg11-29]
MNFKEILNIILKNNLETINEVVKKTITNKGFDPTGGSSEYGPKNIGSISIGIEGFSVNATAYFKYSLDGLRGLSSSTFKEINVNSVEIPVEANTFSARATFNFGTNGDLEAHAGCEIKAKGCVDVPVFGEKCMTIKEGPDARIKMHGYNVNGELSVSGTIVNNTITIDRFDIDSSKITSGHTSVNISGLGPFNSLASNAVSFIAEGAVSNLSSNISSLLPLIVLGVGKMVLPISKNVSI